MSKKFTIILFSISILVLFSTQFGYAINEEPIIFRLKEIITSPEDNSKHEVVLKITNRNSSGAAKIQQIYFAPSSNHDVIVKSTNVSQCRLLKPGKSCQASAVISADQNYVNGSMPISVSYVIDRKDSNTNTGSGLAHSSVSLDNSIVIDPIRTDNNAASSESNTEDTDNNAASSESNKEDPL